MTAETRPGDGAPGYDAEAMASRRASREIRLSILSDESRGVGESLALGLLYGWQAQSELDGGEKSFFDAGAALETAAALAKPENPAEVLDFFLGLELLTPQWKTMLRHPDPCDWTPQHRALARYLTQRYWLQAVSDSALYCRVKFILISCLLVRLVGGDIFSTAQLYSKEIENDKDNVEAIQMCIRDSDGCGQQCAVERKNADRRGHGGALPVRERRAGAALCEPGRRCI